jgi:hypothetical protein
MNAREQITADALRRDIQKLKELVLQCELMAAIPPASCREPELFAEQELRFAGEYRRQLSGLSNELFVLEGQGQLALA